MKRSRLGVRLAAGVLAGCAVWGARASFAAQEVAVRGKVVDTTGAPLSAIVVQVTDGSGRRDFVKTDRRGNFTIIGLEHGQVRVETNHFGFGRDVVNLALKAGDAAQCQISLARTGTPGAQSHGSCRLIPDGYDTTVVQ